MAILRMCNINTLHYSKSIPFHLDIKAVQTRCGYTNLFYLSLAFTLTYCIVLTLRPSLLPVTLFLYSFTPTFDRSVSLLLSLQLSLGHIICRFLPFTYSTQLNPKSSTHLVYTFKFITFKSAWINTQYNIERKVMGVKLNRDMEMKESPTFEGKGLKRMT